MMLFQIAVRVLALACLPTLLHAQTPSTGSGQTYPNRAIRMLVPQAPGSASDNVARLIAAELTARLGQQVVVDNRPGGALTIGIDMMIKSAPDGYTLAYAPIGSLVIGPNMFRKPPYDVNKDIAAVALGALNQMLLAGSPRHPFKSVQEVIDFAKQNPGKLSNASSGNGSPGHVGFELLRSMAGLNVVHVPYKGGAAAITDLIAGQVHLMMESLNSITPHAKAGRVRGLAVTSRTRASIAPEYPTMDEAGVRGFETGLWTALFAPAGTPRPIIQKLNAEIMKALETADLKERLSQIGAEPFGSSPEKAATYLHAEIEKYAKVARAINLKID